MIILDYKDARPIYEQVVDKFQKLILTGALEPNTKMPPGQEPGGGAFHQSKHDTAGLFRAGAGRFYIYGKGQGEFCGL